MLFRKNHEPSCAYCCHGSPINEDSIICEKKGIVRSWDKCRRFSYDPLKRVPETPAVPTTAELREEDFTL